MSADQDDDRHTMSLRMSRGLHAHLRACADRDRRSMNEQIVLLLETGSDYKARKPKKTTKGRK